MPRQCKVCEHESRAQIELELANKVGGPTVAKRYEVSEDSVNRHRKHHMPPQLVAQLMQKGRVSPVDLETLRTNENEGLLQHLVAARGRLYKLADDCEDKGDLGAAVRAIGALHQNAALIARLLGQLNSGHTSITQNILIMPAYHQMRVALIKALRPFPEARDAVIQALHSVERDITPPDVH